MEETNNSNNVENTNDVEIITDEEVDDLEDVTVLMEGQKKKRRRKTSLVWPHFEMISPGPDKKPRCKCKRCGLVYLIPVFMIYLTLRHQMENEDEYMRRMAVQMLAKFEKYWLDFNVLLAIAVTLDPHYKLQFVDFCYKKLYGYSGSPAYLNVREKLFSLYLEYASNAPTTSAATRKCGGQVVHVSPIQSFSKETRAVMQEFDSFEIDEESAHSQKNLLELYLDEPRVDRRANLDILSFWKANQFQFPELASMARDVLSVPISTVASESTFSVGGRVIDQFRSSLRPDTVEALVYTRDWLYGEKELA